MEIGEQFFGLSKVVGARTRELCRILLKHMSNTGTHKALMVYQHMSKVKGAQLACI